MEKLRSLSDVYRYFRTLDTPIYFVSGTPFNLLGLGQHVPSLRYINYFDCFDNHHYRVFTPEGKTEVEFTSMEDVVNYLLAHQEVCDFVEQTGPGLMTTVMFDDDSEELAEKIGLKIALPPASLRNEIDSKIVTTRLGNEAGVASVPNVMGTADDYTQLCTLAADAGLGGDLVVQTPYGDSGRTTFFIKCEDDWDKHSENIIGEQLKVMKRIDHQSGTIEGVATRNGTLVGPLLMEIVGHTSLTPYKGGWSGNEADPRQFDRKLRDKVIAMVKALGDRLYKEGYRGTFCMDFLVDSNSDDVYLGEINPRICGASSLTNLITQKYGGVPLFLFHLLEYLDVDWDIDLDSIQQRWMEYDCWSTLILKNIDEDVEIIAKAPITGIWQLDDEENLAFLRRSWDWSNAASEQEAFFMRILGPGEYIYKGADLGVVLLRGRVQDDDGQLMPRVQPWISALKNEFETVAPGEDIALPQQEGLLYKIN